MTKLKIIVNKKLNKIIFKIPNLIQRTYSCDNFTEENIDKLENYFLNDNNIDYKELQANYIYIR